MTPPLSVLPLLACGALVTTLFCAQRGDADAAPASVMLAARDAARFVRVQDIDFLALLPPPP